jgi:hypothetical protein
LRSREERIGRISIGNLRGAIAGFGNRALIVTSGFSRLKSLLQNPASAIGS